MNIQSIQASNGFLNISIHIGSCGSDFWKYLLLFSHSNSPKLAGLPTFGQFDHILRFHSTFIILMHKCNCCQILVQVLFQCSLRAGTDQHKGLTLDLSSQEVHRHARDRGCSGAYSALLEPCCNSSHSNSHKAELAKIWWRPQSNGDVLARTLWSPLVLAIRSL